jgi:hypothetical protein
VVCGYRRYLIPAASSRRDVSGRSLFAYGIPHVFGAGPGTSALTSGRNAIILHGIRPCTWNSWIGTRTKPAKHNCALMCFVLVLPVLHALLCFGNFRGKFFGLCWGWAWCFASGDHQALSEGISILFPSGLCKVLSFIQSHAWCRGETWGRPPSGKIKRRREC